MWLVVLGDEFNRAHIAAGVARAFSELGVRCTLLEIGRGLPNVGYYFALDPAEYLAPTLDESATMNHSIGPSIRFACAVDPIRMRPFETNEGTAGAAHAIVTAFRLPFDESGAAALDSVAAITARFSGNDGAEGARPPDCIVLFVDPGAAGETDGSIELFGDLFPEAVIFTVVRDGATRSAGEGSGVLSLPADLECSWGRRSPPASCFFSDLATQTLQMLSLRRKKGPNRAAI